MRMDFQKIVRKGVCQSLSACYQRPASHLDFL